MKIIENKSPVAFKDLKIASKKVMLGLSKKKIKAWQDARRAKATQVMGSATVTINIGWPKGEEPQEVPVLAAANFEDRWEVLALYGATHHLRHDEVADVRDAA